MAITLNDNIKINAGKPIDTKYLYSGNTAYPSEASVHAGIPIGERYAGLTVLVNTGGGGNREFWFKTGVENTDLIEKKYDTVLSSSDYVTGATNIGYFSGKTGVQELPIDHLVANNYDGSYFSLYNYYYRGTDGVIHIGTPKDSVPKRGYVKTTLPVTSWIWSDYTGGTHNELVGWTLIAGNIENLIGQFQYPALPLYYNGTTKPYTGTSWTTGSAYNNASNVVINTILGSLNDGALLAIGGRSYAFKEHNDLHFRTIISDTPNTIKVRDDNDALIHLSASTTTAYAMNVGAGIPVYSGKTGTTFVFKTLVGGGNTVVSNVGNSVLIYSSGGTGGDGTYNLASPAAISVGGITAGTTLTGKTSFELFEELLVPTLYPTLVNPSITISLVPSIPAPAVSGLYEIGYIVPTLCVTGNFNAGCITPQYSACSDKRSCGAQAYCFIGSQIASCTPSTNSTFTCCAINYAIVEGTQTWGVKTHYLAGVQPYDNKGATYCTPLPVGETVMSCASLTGILPWYWGMSASMTVNAACVAACGCGGGCKCVNHVGSSPIPITFNSTSDDYIWFALPACAASKTCWLVNSTNNGAIGGLGNLFAASCTVSVNSLESCWTARDYEIYVSCYKSGTATGVPMYIS